MERRDVAIMACAVEILVSVRVPVSCDGQFTA